MEDASVGRGRVGLADPAAEQVLHGRGLGGCVRTGTVRASRRDRLGYRYRYRYRYGYG
jgi:hypothetical protein